MSEQAVASARASVMIYDSKSKKWMSSGSSNGLAKVHIYHNTEKNTFRIVGRKVNDHEVVMNCSILQGLKYFQATATFHQWRDNTQINGLNFVSQEDAEVFALAMERVLDILSHSSMYMSNHRSSQSQPLYHTIGYSGVNLDDYAEYRGWANNANGEGESNSEYGHYRPSHGYISHPVTPNNNHAAPQFNHHRTSSASSQQSYHPTPPPPPPPLPSTSISGLSTLPRLHLKVSDEEEVSTETETSLAQALASAKLKKTPKSNESTPPKKGLTCMMDEMTKTLARRRAQTDCSAEIDNVSICDSNRSWSKLGSATGHSESHDSGWESPKSLRRSDLSDSDNQNQIIMTSREIEKVKQDIILEMKNEVNKMKQDIINAIKLELNRR